MQGDQYEHLERIWFDQITVIFKAMKSLREYSFPDSTEW